MEFPRFWFKATGAVALDRPRALEAWGWSSTSEAEARTVAEDRLRRAVAAAESAGRMPEHGEYYPRVPLREPVLALVSEARTGVEAVITRNRYGAEVLNTDRLFIADIDVPGWEEVPEETARQAPTGTSAGVGAGGPRRGLLGRLFAEPEPARPEITEGAAVEYIRGFAARRPEYGVRIYRTRAGLRVILTGVRETADTEAAQGLLTELGADPRYSALARGHASYRARLTPKPWRAGWHALPVSGRGRFWEGGEDDPTWLAAYRERTAQFAVCRLLEVIGHGGSATEGEVIAFHDSATRVGSPDPLA